MVLTLDVIAVSGQPPKAPLQLELREGSYRLGRNPDNDLVLEDAERMVSGFHARIDATGSGVVLTDCSTNGTFLNDAPDPLPRNQPTPLQEGDQLLIGPYDIVVGTSDAVAQEDIGQPAEATPTPLPGFGLFEEDAAPAAFDPTPEPPPARSPGPGRVGTDESLPGLEQPGAGEDILDLLGGSESPAGGQNRLDRAADRFADPGGGLDDLLNDPEAGRGAEPTPTPVDQVFFRPPTTAQIPEDYDLLADSEAPTDGGDDRAPTAGAAEPPSPFDADGRHPEEPEWEPFFPEANAPQPPEPSPFEQAPAEGTEEAAALQRSAPGPQAFDAQPRGQVTLSEPDLQRPPGQHAAPQRIAHQTPGRHQHDQFAPVPEPTSSGGASTWPTGPESDDAESAEVPGAAEPMAGPAPRPAPGRRSAAPPKPASARGALQAFLTGLGTGDSALIDDPEAFLRKAGALLRIMVGGLSTTLMARTQFKSEMRLGVTTIRATENNPLKFSVSVDDALERLLLRETQGFLPGAEAAKQGFEDIQAHEMAMIAGLRSALDELVGRFAPEALAAELTGKGLDKVLPMARKARCWDLLAERHAQIAATASEDFMKVFGDAFTRAYDEQIAMLARARRERGR
jgi:type VI secretion system FHA domain protein